MISQQQLDELWDFGDPVTSEQRLRAAAASAAGDEGAEYLTQVGRALGLQERFDEARAVLDAISSDNPAVVTRIALERGRIENSSGHRDRAVRFFRSAVELAGRNGLEFLFIDTLHMLAIADADHEADWTFRALQLAEASEDPRTRRWLIPLRNNHGWTLYEAGDRAGAITEFEQSLHLAESIGTPSQQQHAREALAEARGERPPATP